MKVVPFNAGVQEPVDWSFLDHPGWEQFIENVSTGISVYNEDFQLVAANTAFYVFTGLPPDQHLKKTSYDAIVEQLARRNWYGEGDVKDIVRERIGNLQKREFQHFRTWTPLGQAIDIKLDFPPGGGFITFMTDVTDLEQENRALREASIQDPLTKLPNRRYFDEELDKFLALVRRTKTCGALILFDLDGFKAVNDTLGHPVGDDVLIDVGEALLASIREVDLGARLGGDEFAVIVRGLKTPQEAEDAVRKIDERLRAAVHAIDVKPGVGTTAGAKLAGPDEIKRDALIEAADQALYKAKQAGKGRLDFAG